MSYKDMAEDVVQLLADLSLRKAILVGHSMGGSAMMMTALTFPHYVEKLVVVDMSPVRTSPSLSQMTTIFEAMRSIMVDGSPTLSKARKVVDQQLAKYIKSMALRQVNIPISLSSSSVQPFKGITLTLCTVPDDEPGGGRFREVQVESQLVRT